MIVIGSAFTLLNIKVGWKVWIPKSVLQARCMTKVKFKIEFAVTSSQLDWNLMRCRWHSRTTPKF